MRLPVLILIALVTMGHVGSPNVFFQGDAGPYPVRIVVRPPEVVPGAAEVSVRVEAPGVRRVTVRPARWDAGLEGAPPPDEAKPVSRHLYAAEVWLLTMSSYALEVEVSGIAGSGRVSVPVSAAPTKRLAMPRAAGALLASLVLLLFVGGVQLAGAAVREGTLAPGETPDAARRSRGRTAAVATGLLAVLVLAAGQRWWSRVDAEHQGRLYSPFSLSARTLTAGPQRYLSLKLDGPRWQERGVPLVPDHGKLMHLFLLREGGYGAFAHLHPVAVDTGDQTFEAALPELPPGGYRLYADVTEETGFAHTLVGRVDLPPAAPDAPGEPEIAPDPDDSWHPSGDGLRMVRRDREPLTAGRETTLRFDLLDASGRPAALEPYMGMWGHLVLARDDGKIFVHLHPSGSISMAAQQLFERRWGAVDPHAGHGTHAATSAPPAPADALAFPYAFPEPGLYRLWVQARSGGVTTGVFDVRVR